MLTNISKHIKDILFPIFCVECGKEGDWWCSSCLSKHSFSPVLRCPICRATREGATCMACRDITKLDGIISFFEYEEKSHAADLIAQFKYGYAVEIANVWEKIFSRQKEIFSSLHGISSRAIIVPVPLFGRRERERGFNQSEILARSFLKVMHERIPESQWDVKNYLKRTKQTAQQAKLSKEERQKNVAGAFSAREIVPDQMIVLIDDVFTTGATMEECARILKIAGARNVWGVTLARSLSLNVTDS